jgi:hypothetical protein
MKKIGEKFNYRGKKLITVEQGGCDGCFFNNLTEDCCSDTRFSCSKHYRKDQKPVIFKELPFKFGQ